MKRSVLAIIALGVIGAWQSEVAAQQAAQSPIRVPRPINSVSDPLVPAGTPGFTPPQIIPPRVQAPAPAPIVFPTIPVAPPAAQVPMPPGILNWDAELKEATVTAAQPVAELVFYFTNVSGGEVSINHVGASCGCTVPRLPTLPWKLSAGTNGVLPVAMSVAGKSGMVFKTLTVNTDKGWKMLSVKTTILPAQPAQMTGGDRDKNQLLAKADRQAVFKGECASCHVEKSIGKVGKDLYEAACGICHEAEHRATMVPDLHALKHETNAEYWKAWIDFGKEGSLMPAFGQKHGGPLSDQQIASLVEYLVNAIPSKVNAAAQSPTPTTASTTPSNGTAN